MAKNPSGKKSLELRVLKGEQFIATMIGPSNAENGLRGDHGPAHVHVECKKIKRGNKHGNEARFRILINEISHTKYFEEYPYPGGNEKKHNMTEQEKISAIKFLNQHVETFIEWWTDMYAGTEHNYFTTLKQVRETALKKHRKK